VLNGETNRDQRKWIFDNFVVLGVHSLPFNAFFKAEMTRISKQQKNAPLSTVIMAITSKCILKCDHCYEWKNLSKTDVLTPDNLKTILTRLRAYGVNHIQLSGGEPLERFSDLTDLMISAGKGIDFWLLTSGYSLTHEKALILKNSGLTGADISLDHWLESEHNKSRGNPKSFYWAKEAVLNCRKAGLATTLSICTFRDFISHNDLMKYAELAKEWGVGFIRLLEPRNTGRYNGENIELEKEHTDMLEEFFLKMNTSDYFLDYPIVTYPGYNQRRTGCLGAGDRYLYIDSKGDIHACPFCQRIAGNAVSGSIDDAVMILKNSGCHKYEMNTGE
jgi:MoaA/NifB/PqqE/SkfB family radical SAM enzyme